MDTGMLYTKDPVLLAEEREHFLLNEFHPVEDTGFERTCHADRYVFLFIDNYIAAFNKIPRQLSRHLRLLR